MKDLLSVSVSTKEGVWYEGPAEWVRAVGVEGSFEVWPQHAPFMTGLVQGVLTIQTPAGPKERTTTQGFLQVDNNHVLILLTE